jgi:hypothetical protein
VRVVRIAGKARPPQLRRVASGENRDSVEPFLAVPDGAVARRLDIGDRKRLVRALQLLKADNFRLLALEPFDQARQARADSV